MKMWLIRYSLYSIFYVVFNHLISTQGQTLHNSGTRSENSYYGITNCNSGTYYIYIHSAWYGHSNWCSDSDALSNVRSWCHGKSYCAFYFSNGWFGDPCGGYSKSGWVKWYCARNGGWSVWSTWTTCSLMCGSGSKTRSRSCNNPTQVSPGSACSGSTSDSTSCNTGACPTNQLLSDHRGPWRLVFKSPNYVQASGYSDIYSFYAASGNLNNNDVDAMTDFSASSKLYKSDILDNWASTVSISAVRLSGYKSGAEQVYIIFNGFGKSKLTWMDCNNGVIDGTWTDVASETKNYCDMAGTGTLKRNFYINRAYGGCTVDTGWFMLKDYGSNSGCNEFDSTSSTAPFVRYATSSTYANWASSTTVGDSMAIFVLEWHMVFKGVQGVTSSAGYLEALWEGSSTENDDDLTTKTLTKSPSKTYKSKIVEDWSSGFIEQVKYAFFTSGVEKAWVVFDGRSTTKNTWFTDSKVLYSRYTDLTTSMTSDSISGDGVRAFALIRSTGSCSAYTAWMFSLDNPSGSQPCSWDKNVQTRPYFLYSSGTTYVYCQSGSNWNSGSFPAAETMGIFIKGWYPVMKFAQGQSLSPASSVYNLWTGTYTLNDHDSDGQSFATSTKCYKSAIVDSWSSYYIKAVRVSWIVSGVEKAYIVFDAHGSDKNSWFNCDRILYTSYNDINRDTSVVYCSVVGQSSNERRFYLQGVSSSCDQDAGWFAVVEDSSPSCSSWESKTSKPYPMYSDASGYELNTNMAVANVFAISVDMDNYCSTISCLNGATCYERGVKFECVCAGAYYGTFCADRDGVWTDWTAWTTCSTTCYAQGTVTRTRTCTNPSQAGSGIVCPGDSSETLTCIPDLRICSSYNTGTVAENTQYTMVCPTGYHIVVHSAFYGLSSAGCSSSVAVYNLRTHCSAKTTCTFAFSDTYFTDPCNSYTKQGYATMYCRLDVQLTQPRGPWRLVFKAPASTVPTGFTDLYDLFSSSSSFNDDYNHAAMRDFSANTDIYKSLILEDWGTTRTISAVRVSVMDNGGEAHYVIFNGFGKTKMTYWDCDDILESSWIDMKTEPHNMCTMVMNTGGYKRNFFINRAYDNCHSDTGWLFVKDFGATDACSQYDLTSNTPYIMYSTGDTYVTFANNKQYADSLAIFVLEWHMVFKGIEGLVPTAGSLEDSWEGTTTENDDEDSVNITLTTAQNKCYKSANVEYWSNILIDQVKYAYFTNGTEVANVVFDGRGTTKNTWFASTKILYSVYTDITTESKSTASISGDGTRQFALIRNSGACSAYNAWMMALDNPSGAQTCSWDKNVKSRPYFLYSSGTNYSAPELSSAWNSAGFPAADVLGVFIKGWLPVFKWARGQSVSPASSVYDLWSGTYTLNEFEDDSFSFAANSLSYKSSIVDKWSSSYYFSSVRASFYESGIERAYVVFDAHGSTKTTWMSVDRILYSSYKDLQRHISPTSFGVAGYTTFQRRFLAQYYFHNCDGSVGWFGVMERTSGGCAFESKTTRPYPMYSDAGQAENNDNQVVADVFAVSVAFEDYLPCSSSPCQNSYGCFNRGPRFVCNCTGTYYGMICDRRDGAWADWSAWSVCTTTCYAYGTQTRTRTCTNPTKVGVGIDCPSVSSETVTCLPEFNICPEYNTGTIAEGGTYTMICPTNMYIIVDSAFYGNSGASCSDADATYNLRSLCHRKSSCSITFNDALFGDPCSSYSKTATATMKCAENLLLTQHRGPWRIAFKVPSGVQPVGYTDVWDFYQADGSMNDNDIDVMRDFSSGGKYYKSSLLDDWGTNVSISAVRYSAYKSGKEVAYIIYDAKGKNKTNWMDCENVLDSSFIDITYENQTICDFSDATTYKRNFFISKSEVDCTSAEGWLFLKDYGATSGCTNWDATSVTMPYIVYSTDSTFTTWETGNKAYADALVISVLEWDMIFKGVEGVVPSTSSLKSLWEGSDTSNDLDTSVATVTQAPHQVYKSKILEDWQNVIKDMVKFAFFNDGQEVASVVFDGRGTTKTSWFADSKILYSSFDDLTVGSTATCSIAGDGIRAFAIIKTSGACSAHEAWMLVMDDASASKPCSWDKNVRSRPYYLYSASQSASNCETGGSWVSSSFPFAENMAIFMKAWYPVFKFAHGQSISPATSIYDLWTGSYTLNDHDYDGFSFASNTETYKSNIVGNWPKFYVNSVRAAFYTNGIEKAFVVFDAHGSDQNSWFDCSRILYTSWDDLSRDITPAYCSIAGHTSYNRRFYLNYETQSCTNAHGWFGIMEHSSASCSWESKTTRPFAVYSDHTGYELNNNMAVADVFAVSIALDALDSYCDIVTCEHNGTCYNRHGFFECVCNETFYGMVCQTRDGNWTEWSAWATCSTTCWALGSHSRTRTCTNPSPIGSKAIDCSGIDGGHDTETKECIPDLPVCPLYSTGTIATTASPNTYRMVCPTTHYTAAISASFGHSTCSDSSATHDLRWYCDGKINCTIPFSNTVFGNNCYQSSSSGSATLKCVEHTKLTEHRGPWRLVLKAPSRTQATGFSDIASFFEDDGALNDDSISDMVDFSSNGNLYKSSLLPEWGTNLSVSAVRFSIIKSNVEVGYVVFDAKGKNKTDWFDCNNILDSSWVDIVKDTKVYCDLHATGNFKRHFYIGKNDSDCDTASGWFFLKDYGATEDCSGWDKISSNLPSIIYSADNMAVTWSTGNTQTADALALYIMEWRMVFKGIEGEVPSSASSLENLWKGSTQENDNDKSFVTLTTTPSKPFKSLTVDQWTQYNIEMELNSGSFIKSYPYQMDSERTTVQFLKKAGYEVASVVFDGRGTSKNEWFDASKILYSSYEDVASLSSAVSSISGDGVRAFALIQQSSGTCSLIKAWMMAIDKASGPQTCSWDKNIRTRPYFLYSSNSTWSYPDTAGSWSEANFPTAETMGIFIKGWFPIMKAAHGESLLPATGIYNLWTGSHGGINEFEYDAFSFNSSSRTLRSSIIDNWQNHYLPAVRVSLIVGGVEKAFVVFDAHGTDKNNWFNCDRILYTSYGDLNRIIQPQYCSIAGESGALRYFFLAYYINTCSNSYGWFGISERTSGCNWDYFTSAPYAFYSDHTGYELLSNTAVADVFAISVALDDYCVSAPCQNNATCYDRGTQFECICNGTFYGMVCEHRDGNWTEWSAWATCSTTCWALGSHSRTRTCTNPFPVGTKGIDCSGIDGGHSSETKLCIPNLPVCPEYNTGNIFETSSPNSYSMVCPLTHFTMVISAFYGHGSCSDSNALKDLRWLCDGKINCTISFTDSTFGDPCPSPSNYGNAVLKCVQHMKLTQHRGPWQLVFKVPSGVQATGYDDIMSFYAASGSLNEGSVAVMTDFSSGGSLFKSPFLDEWGINRTVSAVKAGVHKGNKEVGYIVFDAMGKGKMDWMDCSRILYSSWLDVHMESTDFCGINNTGNYKRNFFVSKNETDCTSAKGWLLLKDYGATSGCSSWDSTSSPTMPYILYSKDEMAVQWSNGNKDFADALAISVMDWDMVFKGVQGVVPAAGSLKALWEGSDTENENEEDFKTITKYPGKTFKSTIVQQWEKLNIETMKYSFFNDGSEVAWVVFDGRSTTKNTVFDGTNVLYSRYLDMPSLSKAVSSISGDGVRTFELAHQTGSCSNFKAWMMIIDDPSGAQTCSWDKNIQTRPYFMYSSNYTWSYPEEAGSWNSASFPVAETMGIFINGWFPVMKYAHGQSYGATGVTSILDMWTGNYIINEFDYEALNYNTSSKSYKSSLVDTWSDHLVKAVKISFEAGGQEKAFAVFDGYGTNKNSWFDCSRLLYTSYDNLNRWISPEFCGITGDTANKRHFFAQYDLSDCSNSYGWFGMIERTNTGCSWETKTTRPYALYSDHTGYELNTNMAVAEVFAISVALDNYCDSSPCKNNATCYNRETTFECICNGTFYGMDCAHRDGNWSVWAAWGECSVSCYSIGTHVRTRSCSDPTPVGDGLLCQGNDVWQIKECIPILQVCPSYDSGNITEGNSFRMVCPSTHFILVDSGWYGNDTVGGVTITYSYQTSYMYYWKVGNDTFSQVRYNTNYYDVFYNCIDEDAVHDLRAYCHKKINCTVEFGEALFKEDPCPTKLKTGNVQMRCVEHNQLTEFRGPWRVVFKVSSGTTVPGYNDMASLYLSSDSYNDLKDTAMNDFSSGSEAFMSSSLGEWNTKRSINAVRLSVFKNNEEVGFVVFDAWNKTKTTWFDCNNILDSSWGDLLLKKATFCGFQGEDTNVTRNFFISKIDGTCDLDSGWVVVKDFGAKSGCSWDSTTAKTMPYIMYSPNNYYVNWSSADAQYADSLAISVLEWNMVFKGVQGVTSAQGSLSSLWDGYLIFENEDDPTAKTVTKAPNKVVKEKILEDWDDWVFLELAKYSFFNSGQEVAYIIFDTRGDMTKDAFFSDSKIVFSSYEDINSYTKSNIGVDGDGVRKFLVAKDTSSCANFNAWMFVLDEAGGSKPCSFDNNVVTRPYFLYSNNRTIFPPQSGSSWDSDNFPVAEVMAIFLKGWFPVMRVTMGQPLGNATSILDLWMGEHIINEWDYDAVKYTSSKTHKSSIVDNWNKFYISGVRVSYMKGSVEKAYVVFDAHGSNKSSWFDCRRILYTNYNDLSREIKAAYCGITGDTDTGKHFFIEYAYNNCSDYGWFGLIENTTDNCGYVGKSSTPFGLFSDAPGYEQNNALRGYCESNPCQNGATCYDRVGRFECVCAGTFYGMTCLHRDGNWTEWTPWDTCTTTCYAVGTQERYRNCTNPTTEGDGIYCANEDWQIQDCIPAFPICAEYNTGDMNSTYQMVCPWDHYIYVDSAWWGAKSNGTTLCSDSDATTDLKNLCHSTINCTFTFSAALFSQPCTGHSPYGYAKMYCARDGQWTNWEAWTWCPVTCAGGLRTRDRYCTNPTTVPPGQYCPDVDFQQKACLTDPCPICGNHRSGYDDPTNISVFQDTTSGVGYLMLDVNWEIHCCEVISAFEFVPQTDGDIDFLIWRKVNSHSYKVINALNYTVNGSEVGTVVNITLPLKQRLAAAKYDVIGWYTLGQNMINYAPCQGELCPTKARRLVMSKPSVGDTVKWIGTSTRHQNRAYAIRFYTHPNESPFLNQTIISVLAKDSSPIGTSIIDYNIQDDDIGDPLTHTFTHELFELNTTFEYLGLMHFQTTGPLPSKYKAFQLIAYTWDTCHHTSTTTLEVITYNAPPVFHNLPNRIELTEATISEVKLFDVDVKDYSDNDSVCCTLAQVIPGSLNFHIKFINETYSLWTMESPVFDYSGISNYYKLWVCCSDQWGVTANFLEIDIVNVIEKVEYIPPTWFLTAIGASMVPIILTFLMACAVMCPTFFCDAEIEYYYD